jgi:hypothetical protein
MDTCAKKNESGAVIFGFPAHSTLPALLMEGWRHPATFAVKTATSHACGNHLAAVGRLVKAPAFVAMQA